jgi:transposase
MDLMSPQHWKRCDVMKRLDAGSLTVGEAAQVLGRSRRQVQRLHAAYVKDGGAGLVHGNANRAPWNRADASVRDRVVSLFRRKYQGFNDQHFTEKLAEIEEITVSRPTVQRWLREAKLTAAKKRRAPKHRRRRDRKPQAGLMLQWDGSRHDWLEGRGPMMCLMGAIDDATGELLPGAHFVAQESAAAYLHTMLAIARDKGLPHSAYGDQHGALRRNDKAWTLEEELRGQQDPTQVGAALKALGVEVIYALSPQAKGRVERLWQTMQDRLVSQLRLCGSKTMAQANSVLGFFRTEFNRRFTVEAANAEVAWRKVPTGMDLDRVCSFHYPATVQNDNTVRLSGVVLDIPPGPRGRSYARARVDVCQLLDSSWRIYTADDCLIATAPPTEPGELRAKPRRKRSAASRAFRKAVEGLSASP